MPELSLRLEYLQPAPCAATAHICDGCGRTIFVGSEHATAHAIVNSEMSIHVIHLCRFCLQNPDGLAQSVCEQAVRQIQQQPAALLTPLESDVRRALSLP